MRDYIANGENFEQITRYILDDKQQSTRLIMPFDMGLFLTNKIDFKSISKIIHYGNEVVFQKSIYTNSNSIGKVYEIAEIVSMDVKNMVPMFIEEIQAYSYDSLFDFMLNADTGNINSTNIPQFSNFDDGTIKLLKILRQSGDFGPIFDEVGRFLTGNGKKTGAYKKYGENHSKLAELLDLVYIDKSERSRQVYLSCLGREIEMMCEKEVMSVFAKLAIRIPIVIEIIKSATYGKVSVDQILSKYLAETTVIRRRTNVKYIVNLIEGQYTGEKYKYIFENIV